MFDEDFVFEVRPTALARRTLEVILYDFDAYSRHHSIGGVKLPLAHIDLTEKVTMWKGLGPCSEQDAKVSSISLVNFVINFYNVNIFTRIRLYIIIFLYFFIHVLLANNLVYLFIFIYSVSTNITVLYFVTYH